jgi:hypothetical protein
MTFYRYREQSRISKNTRVDSILSLTNLESRLFKGNIEEIKDPINFKKVDDMLSPMIEKSKEFLIEAIKNDKNPE